MMPTRADRAAPGDLAVTDEYVDPWPLALHELRALRDDEGVAPEVVQRLTVEAERARELGDARALGALLDHIAAAHGPMSGGDEPSDLRAIRAERPSGPRHLTMSLSTEETRDRIHAGWLGRAVGCTLGRPVEGWSFADVSAYLEQAGEAEIADYLLHGDDVALGAARRIGWRKGSCRGHVRGVERDDDLDYTILNLDVLSEHGATFTTTDVGRAWLDRLPYRAACTAERVAYRNLVLGDAPPTSATRHNPYREWIGAQIRADVYGYVSPGQPERAAEWAWRDARLSHRRDGIYGAMWTAAAIATAFATPDPREVVTIAASEVPRASRFADVVQVVLDAHDRHEDWRDARAVIERRYGHLHPVHVLNNAAVVASALLFGAGDFTRTVGIAVASGWDTDSNGATAGSIVGVMLGTAAIPTHWTDPLGDAVDTALVGRGRHQLSELAAATATVARHLKE